MKKLSIRALAAQALAPVLAGKSSLGATLPPAQQACPLPPHAGTGRQRSDTHAKPGAHATPLQQGSSLSPQPDAGSHRAARQTKPSTQAPPTQHRCPRVPQSAVGMSSRGTSKKPASPLSGVDRGSSWPSAHPSPTDSAASTRPLG